MHDITDIRDHTGMILPYHNYKLKHSEHAEKGALVNHWRPCSITVNGKAM